MKMGELEWLENGINWVGETCGCSMFMFSRILIHDVWTIFSKYFEVEWDHEMGASLMEDCSFFLSWGLGDADIWWCSYKCKTWLLVDQMIKINNILCAILCTILLWWSRTGLELQQQGVNQMSCITCWSSYMVSSKAIWALSL